MRAIIELATAEKAQITVPRGDIVFTSDVEDLLAFVTKPASRLASCASAPAERVSSRVT